MALAFEILGPLRVDDLQEAWKAVTFDFDVLRIRFCEDQAGVRQFDGGSVVPIDMEVVDSRSAADDRLNTLAREPFDLLLTAGVRIHLIRLNSEGDTWFLSLVIHHLLGDGPTLRMIQKSLSDHYRRRRSKDEQVYSRPPAFLEYALSERQQFEQRGVSDGIVAWHRLLEGCPKRLQLPGRIPTANGVADPGDLLSFELPEDLTRKCQQLAADLNVTHACLFLAAWIVVLRMMTDQYDLVVGVASGGRTNESSAQPGFLAATLPVRVGVDQTTTWSNHVRHVEKIMYQAASLQHVPYHLIVDALKAPELLDACFVFHEGNVANLTLESLEIRPIPVRLLTSMFALTLRVLRTAAGSEIQWEYSTNAFQSADIELAQSRLECILRRAVANPNTTVDELSRPTEREQAHVVRAGQGRSLPVPVGLTVLNLIQSHVKSRPQAPAVVDSSRTLTYFELWELAGQVAGQLMLAGLHLNEPVVIWGNPTVESIAAILGIQRAGGAYLPVDAETPMHRLRQFAVMAGCRFIIGATEQSKLPGSDLQLLELCPSASPIPSELSQATVDGLAYIMLTSGSTGTPKPVAVPHSSLMNHIMWKQQLLQLGPDSHVLQRSSIVFDDSIAELFVPLSVGASLILPDGTSRHDPAHWTRLIQQYQITTLNITPSLLHLLLDYGDLGGCSSLQIVMVGGEVLTRPLVESFREQSPCRLVNTYGPAECTIDTLFWECPEVLPKRIPLGQPVANTSVFILDSNQNLAGIGKHGELYVAGPGVAMKQDGDSYLIHCPAGRMKLSIEQGISAQSTQMA